MAAHSYWKTEQKFFLSCVSICYNTHAEHDTDIAFMPVSLSVCQNPLLYDRHMMSSPERFWQSVDDWLGLWFAEARRRGVNGRCYLWRCFKLLTKAKPSLGNRDTSGGIWEGGSSQWGPEAKPRRRSPQKLMAFLQIILKWRILWKKQYDISLAYCEVVQWLEAQGSSAEFNESPRTTFQPFVERKTNKKLAHRRKTARRSIKLISQVKSVETLSTAEQMYKNRI